MAEEGSQKLWYAALLKALQNWHVPASQAFQSFKAQLVFQQKAASLSTTGAADHDVLTALLEDLIAGMMDKDSAELLINRFKKGTTVAKLADASSVSKESIMRYQKKAIDALTSDLITREEQSQAGQIARFESELEPPTYDKLFGVEALVSQLVEHLLNRDAVSIATVMGMGGVGKSAVTDYAMRQVLRQFCFEHVVWMRYEPSSLTMRSTSPKEPYEALLLRLSALDHIDARDMTPKAREERVQLALHKTPHLIVVDNIEEPKPTQMLLQQLARFGGESRFVVTSRAQAGGAPRVRPFQVSELSATDSIKYMQHLAMSVGFDDFIEADPARLAPIVELLGGNPLALKLAVEMARQMPFDRLLDQLSRGLTNETRQLYTHVYRDLWNALDDNCQRVLGAMLFVKASVSYERLQTHSKLDDVDFPNAIATLTARSLLEPRGTTWERSFGVHQLTKTFLRSELWDKGGA